MSVFTAQRDYIEVEHEFSSSNLFIYTYKFARDSGRMHIVEYIDVSTGEIIPKESAQIREIRPDSMLERFRRLDTLRVEVRNFCTFLLRFRNQACGFLVPISTLFKWYAVLQGRKTSHIKRYLPVLIEAGILQDSITLDKIFMVNNPTRRASDAKGDLTKAQVTFDIIKIKSEARNKLN